jgi:hypothetical protein
MDEFRGIILTEHAALTTKLTTNYVYTLRLGKLERDSSHRDQLNKLDPQIITPYWKNLLH